MTSEYLQGWRFHSLSGQSVPVLAHPHSVFWEKKGVSLHSEVCTNKVTNTIILPNKNSFPRKTLGISAGKRKSESSPIKSGKLSLLVHATAM